mgnify:CR=1 FL=1
MKKKLITTSPILLGGLTFFAINKYKQTKKINEYIEQAKDHTHDIKNALILGDSVAKGYGSANGGMANFLKAYLDEMYGEVRVMNEGILHLTSKGLHDKLIEEKEYDEKLKSANLVFINIGGNDLLQYYYKDGPKAIVKNFFKIRSQYIENVKEIVEYIERVNPSAIIVINNLYNSLEKQYQYYGFTNILFRLWNASMKELSVIRVNTKEMNRNKDLWADMVHPNEAGYEVLSNLIVKELNNLIEDRVQTAKNVDL